RRVAAAPTPAARWPAPRCDTARRDRRGAPPPWGAPRPSTRRQLPLTVTFSSLFSSFTSCLTFALSQSRLPPAEPATGRFIDVPSPPLTPFIAQNMSARSNRPISLSTISESSPAPMVGYSLNGLSTVLGVATWLARAERNFCWFL